MSIVEENEDVTRDCFGNEIRVGDSVVRVIGGFVSRCTYKILEIDNLSHRAIKVSRHVKLDNCNDSKETDSLWILSITAALSVSSRLINKYEQ